MARTKLIDLLGGAAPTGVGEMPVGTDAIPTPELTGSAVGPPPPEAGPEAAAGPEAGTPEESPVEPNSASALAQAPDMTPEQRAELQAQLELAAKEEMMRRMNPAGPGGM